MAATLENTASMIMVENIIFQSKGKAQSEIILQHSTGESTTLTFTDTFPLQAEETYLKAINLLLEKHSDITPQDDLFSLFTWWFYRHQLPAPISVGTHRNDERKRIGNRIKELREEMKMDARHLAMMSGVDAANICRIEQGKYSVGLDILSKIASALGCRVDLVKNESVLNK